MLNCGMEFYNLIYRWRSFFPSFDFTFAPLFHFHTREFPVALSRPLVDQARFVLGEATLSPIASLPFMCLNTASRTEYSVIFLGTEVRLFDW